MIRVRAVLASAIVGLASAAACGGARAEPFVPDDTPWTVDDANPGARPSTIEELLSREHENGADQDIAPPGPDQPDYAAHPQSGISDDRLSPKLPERIEQARERLPDTVRAIEPALAPQPAPTPAATAAGPAARERHPGTAPEPVTAAPAPATMPAAPSPPPAATTAPARATAQPAVAAAPKRPAAAPAPVAIAPAQPAAAGMPASPPEVKTPPPALAMKAHEEPANSPSEPAKAHEAPADTSPQTAPPPAASPTTATSQTTATPQAAAAPSPASPSAAAVAEPAAQAGAVAAASNKLYLPLKRYFEANGQTALARFPEADRKALAAFYDKSVGEPVWVSKDGYNDAAKSLIAEIEKADDWGLASTDYRVTPLAPGSEHGYEELAAAEVNLSLTAMEYGRHARGDRIDTPSQQLSSYIDRKPQLIEAPKFIEALLSASDKGAYLRSLHPKHRQFELLREKLLQLRQQQREGSEPQKIASGPKITPGKEHAQVALVRHLLGTPVPTVKADGKPAGETYFDEDLARAIIDYKTKRQIEPVNATITETLRKSLNQDIDIDEDRLLANMEQWRWMPDDLGETYVWVNIPEFLVRVVKNDTIIHEERIVAGRYETQTPIFSNKMRTVVFQPVWNVPESIKVNELLPKLRAGGNPIEGQGLRVERNGREVSAWDIDWYKQDIRNLHIFQPPGSSNVLGVVKFLFPNKHSVYLHDTPTKKLFNEKSRTFSHGCMRVRNPVRLAEVIMAEDKGWDKAKVDELVSDGPPDNDIALDKPLPVHVTYFTMWVSEEGETQTFADIYGHEKRIKLGLHGRWEEIDKLPDHLAPADPDMVVSREDWGDQDDDATRSTRRRISSNAERGPRGPQGQGAYKQGQPGKHKPSLGDLISNIFGAN